MSEYQAAFFIVPARILNLPKLTMSFLRIYETIFQFLNHGKPCYLSNDMIKERTGITSDSTISDAYKYFEQHGELKRITRNGKRYFVQPSREIEAEKSEPVDKSLGTTRGGSRQSEDKGLGTARHNMKNSNTKNNNKDFAFNKDQKTNKEMKQTAQFWGVGHPDYDRINRINNEDTF